MSRRRVPWGGIGAIAFVSAGIVAVPLLANGTFASWTDAEYATGTVTTNDLQCTPATTGLDGTASARLLAAELLNWTGVNADDQGQQELAGLNGLTVTRTSGADPAVASDDQIAVDPAGADGSGSTPTTATYLNGLASLGLLGSDPILSVPDLDLLMTPENVGALSEWASVGADGHAGGASGLVTSAGGLNVGGLDGHAQPYIATLRLSSLLATLGLAGLGGLADVTLGLGAVEGHSKADGCALGKRALWGDGAEPAGAVDRGYWIAGLGLDLNSPLVGSIVTPVADGLLPMVDGAVEALVGDPAGDGTDGSVVNGILGLLTTVLGAVTLPTNVGGGLSVADVTGDATLSGLDLGPVQALLTETVGDSDGLLTIDLGTGDVHVNLAALLGRLDPADPTGYSLNGLAANTDLLYDADTWASALTAALSSALNSWANTVVETLVGILDDAVLHVGLDVTVGGIKLNGNTVASVANVRIDLTGKLGAIVACQQANITAGSCAGLTTDVQVQLIDGLGDIISGLFPGVLGALLGTLFGGLGSLLGNLSSALLGGIVGPLLDGLVNAVAAPIVSGLLGPSGVVGLLTTQLLGAGGVVPQLLSGVVAPIVNVLLPTLFGEDGLVNLTVNVRPDQPGAPDGLDFVAATDHATKEYAESALRVAVANALSGAGGLVIATLGSASAGPVVYR